VNEMVVSRGTGQIVLPNELKSEIKNGFFANGVLKENIINYVENYASNLRTFRIDQSSIRKIYDSFKSLQLRMQQELIKNLSDNLDANDFEKAEEQAYHKIIPFVKLMKSKSRYAIEKKISEVKNRNRNEEESYRSLEEFIDLCINNIKSKKDFDAFMDLFECIIANLKEA
jgi:CRISPR/Cas system CSM-associated protein Csm2 small subunit